MGQHHWSFFKLVNNSHADKFIADFFMGQSTFRGGKVQWCKESLIIYVPYFVVVFREWHCSVNLFSPISIYV